MRPPLIAVSRASRPGDYLEAIRRAGGEPVLCDADARLSPDQWTRINGILLTGGPDVDPRLYGETPDRTYEPAEPGRDPFEIELVHRALERDVPLLAICRGIQVLNVAAGGTLVQHIPTDVPQPLRHHVPKPAWAVAHDVRVRPGSLVARAVAPLEAGRAPVAVNSRHHQAVKHVAQGFEIVGTSADGVVEAIERPASRFCAGVQWHPENFWRTGEFDGLFAAFVTACGG